MAIPTAPGESDFYSDNDTLSSIVGPPRLGNPKKVHVARRRGAMKRSRRYLNWAEMDTEGSSVSLYGEDIETWLIDDTGIS